MTTFRNNAAVERMSSLLAAMLLAVLAPLVALAAEPREFVINVGQFDRMSVADCGLSVVWHCVEDSTGQVAFDAPADVASKISLEVKNGNLKISTTSPLREGEMPLLHAYSDFLVKVENAGRGSVTVENPPACPQFEAKIVGNGTIAVHGVRSTGVKATIATGNGTVALSGRCSKASLTMLGAGVIQADNLLAGEVMCKAVGSGSIGCAPQTRLVAKGIGSTKIYYRGEPVIEKSGACRLISLDEEAPQTEDVPDATDDSASDI